MAKEYVTRRGPWTEPMGIYTGISKRNPVNEERAAREFGTSVIQGSSNRQREIL